MKISGSNVIAVPRERAFAMLQDPVVLAKCMPGIEKLEKVGEDEYAMTMKMAIAAFSGQFAGKVKITDQAPPEKMRLAVEGSGKVGHVKGTGLLNLTAVEAGTQVDYDGDVQVGGTIAMVGQRLIDSTSKMMIRNFFERLSKESV